MAKYQGLCALIQRCVSASNQTESTYPLMMAHLGGVHVNGDTTGDLQSLMGTLVTDGVVDHHFAITLLQKRTWQEMTEQNPPAQALGYGATQQQPNQIQFMY